MPKDFVFKDWCDDNKIPETTVSILTKDHFIEKELLANIEYGWIASLEIEAGEKIKLRLALEKLQRGDLPVPSVPSEFGAESLAFGGARLKVKTEPTDLSLPAPLTDRGSSDSKSEASEGRQTTTTLAKNKDLANALSAFLSTKGHLEGFRDLLSLAEAGTSNPAGATISSLAGGERVHDPVRISNLPTAPIKLEKPKPLLIRDFLVSTLSCQYEHEDELFINESTKIVVSGKSKKPEVEKYTVEQWSAANLRIITHLFEQKSCTCTHQVFTIHSGEEA